MNYEEAKMEIIYYIENNYVVASNGTIEYETSTGYSQWSIRGSDS